MICINENKLAEIIASRLGKVCNNCGLELDEIRFCLEIFLIGLFSVIAIAIIADAIRDIFVAKYNNKKVENEGN